MEFKEPSIESHNTEWKWSWSDEYLDWIAGYANAEGGRLFIGVNDDGYIVGVENCRELLEFLPNKISNRLNILSMVKLHTVYHLGENLRYGRKVPVEIASRDINKYACGKLDPDMAASEQDAERIRRVIANIEKKCRVHIEPDGAIHYIEIITESYPFAVPSGGHYFKRSGSVLRELTGLELNNFLLEKANRTWDSLPVPHVSVEDLDRDSLNAFRRKAVENKRMTQAQVDDPDQLLLEKLKLVDEETGQLTRAAVLLFHRDPERFIRGSVIKVAYFAPPGRYGMNAANDIIYQDMIDGPLITQVDKAIDIIYLKYLKALISYEGITRVETYMWPKEAFREILLNAIKEKAYETCNPIQIKIYDDHITVFNEGKWPTFKLPLDKLYEEHSSYPRNPLIANVFFMAGEVESWGSGFEKIKNLCDAEETPYPDIDIGDEVRTEAGITVTCRGCRVYMELYKENLSNEDSRLRTRVNSDGATPEADGVNSMRNSEPAKEDSVVDGNESAIGSVKNSASSVMSSVKFGNIYLSATAKGILSLIEKDDHITAEKMAIQLTVTKRAVEKNIRVLREAGILERVGRTRGGYWVIRSMEESQ